MTGQTNEELLLRIFLGENDRHGHIPLYEAIVEHLRREGIAGTTVLRGVAGFGGSRAFHADRLLDLAHDLPLVIEAIDKRERLEAVIPSLRGMLSGGLITLESVTVIRPLTVR